MNLKTAMLEALVQEWEGNARMNRVVELAWSMAGKKPADDVRKYTDLAAAVRARHIEGLTTVRIFVGRYLPKMGDALLDRRPRESCIAAGLRDTWRGRNDDGQGKVAGAWKETRLGDVQIKPRAKMRKQRV
jgi:hypothetical protein